MRAVRHAANPTTGIPYWSLERGVVENEAIYLFLHATLAGLVEMDWLIYCPLCSDCRCKLPEPARCSKRLPLPPVPRRLRSHARRLHRRDIHPGAERAPYSLSRPGFPSGGRLLLHVQGDVRRTFGRWDRGRPCMELMRTSMRGSGRIRPGETALFALEAEPGLLIGGIMESDAFFVFELSGERRSTAKGRRRPYGRRSPTADLRGGANNRRAGGDRTFR
jgi:hypothetical protein